MPLRRGARIATDFIIVVSTREGGISNFNCAKDGVAEESKAFRP
jgi:hypothetical protein